MPKYVPDAKTRRWLVVVPDRLLRPRDRKKKKDEKITAKNGYAYEKNCPFCLGNEKMTPPEVFRWEKSKNWKVRVVPNKYPITDIHEVIIHSPDHQKDIAELPKEHVEILFKVFRERFRILSKEGQVLIFNNKGWAAGPSLAHPHSQVVVIPKQVKLDVLTLEPVKNVVFETKGLVSYCPDFSQWPYEVWIAKKSCFLPNHQPGCLFGSLNEIKIKELAEIVQKILRQLTNLFPDLSYNFYISPVGCWYLRIIPRLTLRAGFELGTGLHVNIVEPAEAAKKLKASK